MSDSSCGGPVALRSADLVLLLVLASHCSAEEPGADAPPATAKAALLPYLAAEDVVTRLEMFHAMTAGSAAVVDCPKSREIKLFVHTEDAERRALVERRVMLRGQDPQALGFGIEVVKIDKFELLSGEPDGKCGSDDYDPRARERPTPIGVFISRPARFGGTLGCRVHDKERIYALSNSHVLYPLVECESREVIQPGYDPPLPVPRGKACRPKSVYDHSIGVADRPNPIHWRDDKPIRLNTVDAALAVTTDDCVDRATPEKGGYGTPLSDILGFGDLVKLLESGGQLEVQKCGMATCRTEGVVRCVARRIRVSPPRSSKEAEFVNQLIIEGDRGAFTLPGDSGSLVVGRGGDHDRRPVGLLFARSEGLSVANPIDQVLCCLQVAIDGTGDASPPDPSCECGHGVEEPVMLAAAGSLSEVVEREQSRLLRIEGVTGVEAGLCEGRPCIRVVLDADAPVDRQLIPRSIDGYEVEVILGGFELLEDDRDESVPR